MFQPIVFLDRSRIREGRLEEVKAHIGALARFVEAEEPRALAYRVYLDEAGTRVTVLQIHPDSASMEHHMAIAAGAFTRFAGLLDMETMEVYGSPSASLVETMQRKARMLGTATVQVHALHAGFARFGDVPAGAPPAG
jgi:quinol monooxygenase YgiN